MPTSTLWLGSESSYLEAQAALAKVQEYQAGHPSEDEEDDESPYMSIVDGVAIITVQGSLLDGTFGRIGQWFGITGYGDIQQALVQAVKSPNVASVLMVYKSGGGAVAGINETQQLIRNVDAVKPVFAYSPSTMCSAALWAGVSARKVFASDTAVVGSIGVLSMVVSRHRQLKEDGIDAVIVRSGKYKALGHPVDPMSDEAVEELQAQIDYLGKVFLDHVADRRGVTAAAADARFGQGRTFVGEQAKSVGLIDDVVTYGQAFQTAKAAAPTDNKTRVFASANTARADIAHNTEQPKGQNTMPNPHIPSEAELLAMANGIVPDAEEQSAAKTADENDAAAQLTAATAQAEELKAQLAAATAELQTAKEQLEAATSAKTALEAVTASLTGIVKASIKSMSLPLNKSTDTVEALTPEQTVQAHAEVSKLFKDKIKVGGVAAPSKTTAEDTPSQPVAINPLFAAAAHLNKQRKGA